MIVAILSVLLFLMTCLSIYLWLLGRERFYQTERQKFAIERIESRWEGTSDALAHEQDRNEQLQKNLDNAYRCLDLALQATPGNFSNIATELGLNGVVYQFHSKEVMKESVS